MTIPNFPCTSNDSVVPQLKHLVWQLLCEQEMQLFVGPLVGVLFGIDSLAPRIRKKLLLQQKIIICSANFIEKHFTQKYFPGQSQKKIIFLQRQWHQQCWFWFELFIMSPKATLFAMYFEGLKLNLLELCLGRIYNIIKIKQKTDYALICAKFFNQPSKKLNRLTFEGLFNDTKLNFSVLRIQVDCYC